MTRFVDSTITFPYKRSLGPVVGAFMTALTEKPHPRHPQRRRPCWCRPWSGTRPPVPSWPTSSSRSARPARSSRGPGSRALRAAPARPCRSPSPSSASTGRPRRCCTPSTPARPTRWPSGCGWRPAGGVPAVGRIDDIVCFVPRRGPRDRRGGHRRGRGAGGPDGLPGLHHLPEPRPRRAPTEPPRPPRSTGCSGLRCPVCERVYAGGRGYCPIDAIELGPDCEVDLPHTGTITNFAIVTPVQYPGQTETEPFVRAFVLLDGTDVHRALLAGDRVAGRPGTGRPAGRRRVGLAGRGRSTTAAAWAGPGVRCSGWMPNGEPDVDDPDLVNRIF